MRIEVAPGATWERFEPFSTYRPRNKARAVEDVGPHLDFLNLYRRIQKDLVDGAMHIQRFAENYGLLGLFSTHYLEQNPALPEGKYFIAPEAVIDERGKLWQINAATEGKAILSFTGINTDTRKKLFRTAKGGALLAARAKAMQVPEHTIAMPHEVAFPPTDAATFWPLSKLDRKAVPWETAREHFGGLLILDKGSPTQASVLCTSEPLNLWKAQIAFFPPPNTLVTGDLIDELRAELHGISPYPSVGENGRLEQSWQCRNLLQAMYLMLYLDETSDKSIRKCASTGCPDYFRVGSQCKTIYCSNRCASRASTRMTRGQEP